jgi:tripartite-type tricarboxylate transporter receptor subunit TctC
LARFAVLTGYGNRRATFISRLRAWIAWLFGLALSLPAIAAAGALGEDYPTRPIRLLTAGTGGGSDTTARVIADGLATRLGQPVVVDSRTGGAVIADLGAKAPPDGYTVIVYSAALWLLPLMQEKPTYDAFKAFAPVTLIGSSPMVLVVNPAVPAKSVQELIALAKAKPRELNYASGPLGATPHIAGELFKLMANVDIVLVPYRSIGAAITDVLGGRIQVMFPSASTAMPHIRSGKLRGLGVASLKPSLLAPSLVPIADSGLPGFEAVGTFGVFTPAKTPSAIIRRLNEETVHVVTLPAVTEKLLGAGIEVVASSPEGLMKQMKSDLVVIGNVIRAAKIRLD